MTNQHLIIKIQALLGGRANMSEMEKRALALDYCRLCSAADSTLEHCIALIKAGREYPALQVAESSDLLDTIDSLCFEENRQWIDFCIDHSLPYPSRFDDAQIKMLAALYGKGITQTHPLYRDYRRAMRMRKYEDALGVIKTIGKINSYDAEVRGEINRLTKLVVKRKLEKLRDALEKGDDESFYKDFDFVENNTDFISDSALWNEIVAYKNLRSKERDKLRCEKVLSEIAVLDAAQDWERILTLASEFNALKDGEKFDECVLEKFDLLWKESLKIQEERLNALHELEARKALGEELDTASETNTAKRLAKIIKLKNESGVALDTALEARVAAEIKSLKRAENGRKTFAFFKFLGVAATLCLLSYGGWFLWSKAKLEADAKDRISALEKLKDFDNTKKYLENFEKDFPELSKKSPYLERLLAIGEDLKNRQSQIDRVKKFREDISGLNLASASTPEIVKAAADLEKMKSGFATMNGADAPLLRNSVEQCTEKFERDLIARKKVVAEKIANGLDDFDKILGEYEVSDLGDLNMENKCDEVLAKLEVLMSDTSRFFKAEESDSARYAELLARLKTARQSRGKYMMLVKSAREAKNLGDYIAAIDGVNQIGDGVAKKYTSPFLQVLKNKAALKNLFAFGLKNFDFPLDEIPEEAFTKSIFTKDRFLIDVYKYSKISQTTTGSKTVYTRGAASEQTNNWSAGSEVIQQADEISAGGLVSKSIYRMQSFKGGKSRGETLVGGAMTAESKAGRATLKIASEKSTLLALNKIQNAEVNPIYKLMLERSIFAKLSEEPIGSGLAYSPSAMKRKDLIEKASERFFPYSWIFETQSKAQLIRSQLYSESNYPDYEDEALAIRKAVAQAKANPPRFLGVADENGKFSTDSKNHILAFAQDGVLSRFSAEDFALVKLLPYSPIFEEQVSLESVVRKNR